MALSIAAITALIDIEASRLAPFDDPIARIRRAVLLHARNVLAQRGFPTDPSEQRELSIVPLVFQEALYDDIDWYERRAPLGRLATYFVIDFAIQSGGRERAEVTDETFGAYVAASNAACEYRKRAAGGA